MLTILAIAWGSFTVGMMAGAWWVAAHVGTEPKP